MGEALTIAIPFYARLDYLELALQSVLAQEDARWRLVVVDDSPEKRGARGLVERLGDGRLAYLANDGNLGMVRCWNRCLDVVESELVTLLHADDLLLPNYVGLVLRAAAEHARSAAFFCATRTIDAAGRACHSLQDDIKRVLIPRSSGDLELAGEGGLCALMRGDFIVCPSLCWRRSVLGARRFDERWRQVQDLELLARLLLAGETLVGSRTRAYAYRRHAHNATARQTESMLRFEEEFQVFDEIAVRARAQGWSAAARTAERKTIVRLHLGWRALAELAALRPAASARFLRFLLGRRS